MHEPKHIRSNLMVATLAALLASCGGTSVPQPQPVPGPLASALRASTPQLPDQSAILVIGLPGAVIGVGEIRAENVDTDAVSTAPTSAAGSFSVVVNTIELEQIALRFANDDGVSEPVTLARSLGDGPVLGPSHNQERSLISPVDGEGEVTVSNDAGPGEPPLIDATPEVELLVANERSGEVVTSQTDEQGLFAVQIAARSLDVIRVMLVDPDTGDISSDFISGVVP